MNPKFFDLINSRRFYTATINSMERGGRIRQLAETLEGENPCPRSERDFPSKNQNGFIALTSAIIISILLIAFSLAVSTTGFFGRFNILDSENKQRSLALAEACGDEALLRLIIQPGYQGDETVTVGGEPCHIFPITSGVQVTIRPQGSYGGATTNLQTTFNGTDYSLISWQETPD